MPGGHSKPLKPQWHHCPVQYCITKSENRKGFYYVPEHPILRKDWLNACGIDSSSTTKEIRICWRHFHKNDFQNELGFGRLKKNVFPSQFPPTFVTKSNSYLDLFGEAEVGNNPDISPVPLYHGDPPEESQEIIIHNELSNDHDYTPHKASTIGPAKKI